MANYAVTDYQTKVGRVADVIADMETYLETIVDTKVLRYVGVVPVANDNVVGVIIHDA